MATNPQSRGGRRGSGMVPFERALVSSYRPSIVTFPTSLRVSEILRLLCSSAPSLFPTLTLVSPKFSHVPLGVGGYGLWELGLLRAKVLGYIHAISFQDFQPM